MNLKYKIYSIIPLVVYNILIPFGDKAPIIYGNWGIYIWAKLAFLLFSYVIIYKYLYDFFWNFIQNKIFYFFDKFCLILNNFFVDTTFFSKYLENFIAIIEFLCFHYFLYFLFIM